VLDEVEKLKLNIIHEDERGFNVIVKFTNDSEKEKLINLATSLRIEYTLCPRDIRIREAAVCFEVKRLQ
jgi:hypothetical protein